MNQEYQFKYVGSDIMFDVSAIIADLSNGTLLESLGLEKNSIIKAPFDHDDLIVSLFDIISKLSTSNPNIDKQVNLD